MEYTEKQTEAMYLDYFNNYLTVDLFAEHHQIEIHQAKKLLSEGRLTHLQKYK
tara:strand:- start:254 stop:412 length:159 start_codon:yes stop_codon:yes gene_type:complete